MPYLIGTDEAGYGPNLGPLVVAASVWFVPDRPAADLYTRLRRAVCREVDDRDPPRVAIADSKQLYQPARGLADLERGVLACIAANRTVSQQKVIPAAPATFRALYEQLAPRCHARLDAAPWYLGHDEPLPVAADSSQLSSAVERLVDCLAERGVRLVAMHARVVQPDEFNELIECDGGKATCLSQTTLDLLAAAMETLPDDTIHATCDKHGGRNRYQELLQTRFPDYLVEVHRESRAESLYRFGPPTRRSEVRFRTQGESFLPTALASMTAKYLRELHMRAFNAFWRRDNPQLRPTAGYPTDAHRFRSDIAAAQQRLGICDRMLWRNR
jgi:ribonuclease HII